LAVLLQIGRCHYLLVDMCNISRITYLLKNRRETGQYNFRKQNLIVSR
jgi:hypothetical protein